MKEILDFMLHIMTVPSEEEVLLIGANTFLRWSAFSASIGVFSYKTQIEYQIVIVGPRNQWSLRTCWLRANRESPFEYSTGELDYDNFPEKYKKRIAAAVKNYNS